MSEIPKLTYPEHVEKAPAGLFEHYCMHPDCKAWGSFGFEKRTVLVETNFEEKGDIKLAVRDSGTGVDTDAVEKLFEAFYTTKAHGMGVGLSICRSIIESHGGRLWADANHDGPGATFAFGLPGATDCPQDP